MARRGNKRARRLVPDIVIKKGLRRSSIRHREPMRAIKLPTKKGLLPDPIRKSKVYEVGEPTKQKVTKSNISVLQLYKDAVKHCKGRKAYKKQMLRKVAAQVKKSGGSMSDWRRQRAVRRKTVWEC